VARISEKMGIHVVTLYIWRKAWRLQAEAVPASEKEPEGWSAADKFTVVLETAGLNDTELGAYCWERGLFSEQVYRWRQAATDANATPVLTIAEQKELERLRAQDQREIKALKKELQRMAKALAKAAALLMLRKKCEALSRVNQVDGHVSNRRRTFSAGSVMTSDQARVRSATATCSQSPPPSGNSAAKTGRSWSRPVSPITAVG
jgi:transposase